MQYATHQFDHEPTYMLIRRYAAAAVEFHIAADGPTPPCIVPTESPDATPPVTVITKQQYAKSLKERFDHSPVPLAIDPPQDLTREQIRTHIHLTLSGNRDHNQGRLGEGLIAILKFRLGPEMPKVMDPVRQGIPRQGEPLRRFLLDCERLDDGIDGVLTVAESFAHADALGLLEEHETPTQIEPEQIQAQQDTTPTTSHTQPLAHVLEIEKPEDLTIKISLSEITQHPVTMCGPTGKTRSLSWKDFGYKGINARKKILHALTYNHGFFDYRDGDKRDKLSRYIHELNEDIRRVLGIPNTDMRFVKCQYMKGVITICKIQQAPD